MRGLFLIPWFFLLLGLLPLVFGSPRGPLLPGLALVLAASLLAGASSLYSRFPLGARVRLSLVLALSLLVLYLALEGALGLLGTSPSPYLAGLPALAALGLGLGFFYGTGSEAPLLAAQGVGTQEDLRRLSGALEGLALRRPLYLLYLQVPVSPEVFQGELRRGDLAFRLGGAYLLILQGGKPEEAAQLLKRLKARFPVEAYAVERWRGGSLESVLSRLRAETLLQG